RNLDEDDYEPMYKRKEFIDTIEKDGEINDFESAWIRQDGSIFFVRESAQAIRDSHGKTLYYDGVMEDITERKRAEKALQESIERYKNLTEISPVGIFHTDEKGLTTYVNPIWCQISGLSFEEALGNGWLRAVHPDDKEKLFKGWQEAVQLHKTSFSEYRFVHPDGTIVWVIGQASPETNPENQIVGYIGTITNITELKYVEESLKRERNLFRLLIDNLPDPIYVKDTEFRKTIANVADVRNMGRQSEAEVLGKTDFDLYPADIAARFYADDLSVIQSGKSVLNKEEFFLDKDGKKVWLLTFKIPMKDEQGRIIGLVGASREITEQKHTMEVLTLLSHTVKSIGESISITDLKNNIIFVNEAFLKTYGYTEEELIGKSISIVSCDPIVHEQMVLAETVKGGWQGELLNRKKDGTLFSIFLSSSIVYDEKEQPIGLVGVATDITERKQTEKALQESQALYHSFVEHLPASVFRKDSKGRYVFVNSLFCELKGLKVDEVLGKSPHELEAFVSVVKTTRPSIMMAVQHTLADQGADHHEIIMRTGKPIEVEEVYPQLNGTTKYFHAVKSPVFASDGKIIGTQGVQFDITERKIAQEELQKERNLLRMVIDNLPDAIYTKDSNCRKTLTNKTDVYIMGCESEAEVLGKDDYDLFPKEMADKFIADDRYVIQTGRPLIDRVEYVVDVQGQKHFLLTTKLPFRNEQGQIIGLIGIGHDITERKRAEDALQESNEKLRNIVEHSTNLFYSRNTDQVFTYLSPQARDIFDCEPDEALIRFTDFMTDNPINKLGCELAGKAIQTGLRQETYELELMGRKGRRVWVEIQEAPVVKDRKTISIVGAMTDITERRWAEMALQVSEKKYRDIVTWAPVGIYQSTLSGKLLSGNSRIAEMLGYDDVSELVGNNIGQTIYYDEKDWERFVAEDNSFEKKVTLSHETRWKKKDGSIIWILMTVHDVRDKSSEILYYEGFVFEITERKHAEEALRESEERYRLLVENSTDIVTEISAEGKYLYVSANVKSILDFEPMNLVGTNVLSRVYGKDKAAIGEILSKLGGSAMYRYRDHLGGWHWFESSGRVYYTSSGEQRMVMVSRDITDRRKAEQELELSRKQLQHFTEHLEHILEEERKRISRELHDELGQLLTILKFDLSWLKLEEVNSDSDTITRINGMMESVNAALTSVKRIAREMRPPQLDALGLIGAMRWDIDQVEKKTGLKGIVTGELADVEIKGQISTVLYRVFREAMTNVLRHAQAKQIFIGLSQRLGSIIFTIRDDGRGITKKELKRTTSLGLVGIRERIRMIGGTFTIEGKPGSGTILTVEIPLKKTKKNGDSIS
ncbi:MAG: PAS domain S-box protein, partial [Bacteroidota bacterium]